LRKPSIQLFSSLAAGTYKRASRTDAGMKAGARDTTRDVNVTGAAERGAALAPRISADAALLT
jgi:hypothetical protein